MSRREARKKFQRFNLVRKLRARLFRAPAYSHQLLDAFYSVLKRKEMLCCS